MTIQKNQKTRNKVLLGSIFVLLLSATILGYAIPAIVAPKHTDTLQINDLFVTNDFQITIRNINYTAPLISSMMYENQILICVNVTNLNSETTLFFSDISKLQLTGVTRTWALSRLLIKTDGEYHVRQNSVVTTSNLFIMEYTISAEFVNITKVTELSLIFSFNIAFANGTDINRDYEYVPSDPIALEVQQARFTQILITAYKFKLLTLLLLIIVGIQLYQITIRKVSE